MRLPARFRATCRYVSRIVQQTATNSAGAEQQHSGDACHRGNCSREHPCQCERSEQNATCEARAAIDGTDVRTHDFEQYGLQRSRSPCRVARTMHQTHKRVQTRGERRERGLQTAFSRSRRTDADRLGAGYARYSDTVRFSDAR